MTAVGRSENLRGGKCPPDQFSAMKGAPDHPAGYPLHEAVLRKVRGDVGREGEGYDGREGDMMGDTPSAQ